VVDSAGFAGDPGSDQDEDATEGDDLE